MGTRAPAKRSKFHAPPGWHYFRIAGESLFPILFPSQCRLCHHALLEISRLPVCQSCLDSIKPFSETRCSICGEALSVSGIVHDGFCGMCRRAKPHFDLALAFGAYEGSLRGLIHLLKYDRVKTAAGFLGGLLAGLFMEARSAAVGSSAFLVIPVPLYRAKRWERGFNQSELLVRSALKHLNKAGSSSFELHTGNLKRVRATASQTGLTRHQRRENVRGAFAALRPQAIRGRDILLVDDVLTTGTTLNECARILRRAGAKTVRAATVARVFKHGLGGMLLVDQMNIGDRAFGEERAIAAKAAQA
jgi:ComF family protein